LDRAIALVYGCLTSGHRSSRPVAKSPERSQARGPNDAMSACALAFPGKSSLRTDWGIDPILWPGLQLLRQNLATETRETPKRCNLTIAGVRTIDGRNLAPYARVVRPRTIGYRNLFTLSLRFCSARKLHVTRVELGPPSLQSPVEACDGTENHGGDTRVQ